MKQKAKSVRIALASMKSMFIDPTAPKHDGVGDIDANLARHRYWLDKALAKGASFIGFPEFALNGWSRRPESALSLSAAPIKELERWAKRERVWLATGFLHGAECLQHNTNRSNS
ncbi:MAG: nitrilase-related carbon-nitrogen hydrolase [Lentisphaeria bacterium]|jgi:predicted amidohydrolase